MTDYTLINFRSPLDDIENQNAAFLAKQVDPSGKRTVGMYGSCRDILCMNTALLYIQACLRSLILSKKAKNEDGSTSWKAGNTSLPMDISSPNNRLLFKSKMEFHIVMPG